MTMIRPLEPFSTPTAMPLVVFTPFGVVIGITYAVSHPAATNELSANASARCSAGDPIGRGPISPARVRRVA
ncbi:MAG: hypothetical protein IPI01_09180 [Ignavibacteriae bacterium]|nr:hypothetical protein [Ignavibacteriota bacterium]